MRSCSAVGVAVPLPPFAVQWCNARILCLCLVRHRLSTLVVVAPCAQCITPNTQQSPHLSAGALQVCSMCCVVMPALCGVRRSRRLCLRVPCGVHYVLATKLSALRGVGTAIVSMSNNLSTHAWRLSTCFAKSLPAAVTVCSTRRLACTSSIVYCGKVAHGNGITDNHSVCEVQLHHCIAQLVNQRLSVVPSMNCIALTCSSNQSASCDQFVCVVCVSIAVSLCKALGLSKCVQLSICLFIAVGKHCKSPCKL
jgi:hypothetical protein